MKIKNNSLLDDMKSGIKVSLDIGCGKQKKEGCYGVDRIDNDSVDVVANLNEPLHVLPDNIAKYVYSSHVLEHVDDLISVMNEIYRISAPDADIVITVPHFSDVFGYSDPTHVRLFGIYSFYYFSPMGYQPSVRRVPDFYSESKFEVVSIKIDFYKKSMAEKMVAPILHRLVNINIHTQIFYERRISRLWHAAQLHFILRPLK